MAGEGTDAEKQEIERDAKKNADAIKDVDGTETYARGNVHSEPDNNAPDTNPPPPFPN